MTIHCAFLRAINLGKHRKFPKDEIVASVRAMGGEAIETYIATGNLRFEHAEGDPTVVRALLEAAFAANRSFDVPTVVMSPAELAATAADAQRLLAEHPWATRSYVYLLASDWEPAKAAELEALSVPDTEIVRVSGRGAHLLMAEVDAFHKSPFTNDRVERYVGVATNRNFNVVTTLAQKWASAAS